MQRPRVTGWLIGALILHAFGAFTWYLSMAFAADAGTVSEAYVALGIGAATWFVAALLMVWLFQSEKWPAAWVIPFVWWFPSWILAFAVAYGL